MESRWILDWRISEVPPHFVSKRFKIHARRVGLREDLHFHSLRHTFATWLVQEGVSIYEVQKLLGHSSISVTQIYSHLAASELHGAVNKIQVVLNGGGKRERGGKTIPCVVLSLRSKFERKRGLV